MIDKRSQNRDNRQMNCNCHPWTTLALLPIFFLPLAHADADADVLKLLDQGYQERAQVSLLRGAAVTLVSPDLQNGETAVGYGDATPDSLLEIGSISKSFTGISIALLSLQKKIDLEAPISNYIPEFKGTFIGTVTPHLLATHSAQLVRWFNGLDQASETQLIAFLKNYRPDAQHPAGLRTYSNLGFATLSLVIRRVTHDTFKNFVSKNIFTPLKMNRSGFADSPKAAAPLLQSYDILLRPIRVELIGDLDAGAGGIFSSANDLLKFLKANMKPESVPALSDAIRLSQKLGLGWDSMPGDNPTWKNGAMDGFGSLIKFDSVTHVGAVVIVNSKNAVTAGSLCDIIVEKKDNFRADLIPAESESLIGTYDSSDGLEIKVFMTKQGYLAVDKTKVNSSDHSFARLRTFDQKVYTVYSGTSSTDHLRFADATSQRKQIQYSSFVKSDSNNQATYTDKIFNLINK